MFSMFVIVFVIVIQVWWSPGCQAKEQQLVVTAFYPRPLSSLYLRGNADNCGLNWSQGVKMTPSIIDNFQSTGQKAYAWTAELICTAPSSGTNIEMKVLIDDSHWMLGANHHFSISPTTTNTSIVDVTAKNSSGLADTVKVDSNPLTDSMFPWFFTCEGSLTTISRVYSAELQNFRDVIVYLPPSYNENTLKRFRNILVMHDGQNLFNPQTSAFGTAWMCQNTLNDLILQGRSDEVLVVGAYNTNDRNNEYTYVYDPSEGFGGKGDLYLNWYVLIVIYCMNVMAIL
jgi:hypothetical protein